MNMKGMCLQILLQKKTKEACIKNTWLQMDFDSFGSSHAIATCVNTNPEPVLRIKKLLWRKTWLKTDFMNTNPEPVLRVKKKMAPNGF